MDTMDAVETGVMTDPAEAKVNVDQTETETGAGPAEPEADTDPGEPETGDDPAYPEADISPSEPEAGTDPAEPEAPAEPEVSAAVKANAAVLHVFRLVASEFDNVDDDTVCLWFDLTAPLVSHKLFGKLYDQAVALMAAHRMKLSGKYENTAEGGGGGMQLGSVADSLRVSSYSEGSTSVSFNNSVSLLEKDADLALTTYGTQYLSLRRQVIIPIRCSGECGT